MGTFFVKIVCKGVRGWASGRSSPYKNLLSNPFPPPREIEKLEIDNVKITEDAAIANSMNEYYTSVASDLLQLVNDNQDHCSLTITPTVLDGIKHFRFKEIKVEDVLI